MAMTPGRPSGHGGTPQRFTPRSASSLPGKVRRALDGAINSTQRNGKTIEVGTDGRLETRVAAGGGLKSTKQGLVVDQAQVGEKNHLPIQRQADLSSASTAAEIAAAYNDLLAELRRTGRMRG